MMRLILIITICFLFQIFCNAQSVYYPRKHNASRLFERSIVTAPSNSNVHLAFQKFLAIDVFNHSDSAGVYSKRHSFNQEYLKNDNLLYVEKTAYSNTTKSNLFFKYFYNFPSNFIHINKPSFQVIANPVIDFNLGKDSNLQKPIFQNTRGFELKVLVDEKIYFYSSLFENQRRFLDYIDKKIRANSSIPGQGFYKRYRSGVLEDFIGFDYLNAVAYFGVPISKNIHLELGHGNHFIGHGYHSLLLNDYSHNYFYLSLSTNIWKFHYKNIFAELASISSKFNEGSLLLPKKYMASHYLSYKPLKNLELGLFETVVFSREDHFEFQYLNPIILYRTVEQFLDSPDNVLIGLNGRWDIFKTLSLYGQCIIDEFKIREITSNDGWWGNKYGIQLGLQYFDVAHIDFLDFRAELNVVRPYTYSHFIPLEEFPVFTSSNYSHYSQPLAHPLGSNFQEILTQFRYQITTKLNIEVVASVATRGLDSPSSNYGSNILITNDSRPSDYGVRLLQGEMESIQHLNIDLNYQVFHNAFLDFQYVYHNINSEALNLKTNYFGGGIRFNIAKHHIDY